MDPKACLEEIRRLSLKLLHSPEDDTEAIMIGLDLADHIRNLDQWMSKGGFSPWENEK